MTRPAPEIAYVDSSRVACDGSEGALGHPRVYLQMDATGAVDCPYCDKRYVLTAGPADDRAARQSAA